MNLFRDDAGGGEFTFDYLGDSAKIVSVNDTDESGQPYNILRVPARELVAVDYQQDRTIDVVKRGSQTLDEAQRIYDIGLTEAIVSGHAFQKEPSQTLYSRIDPDGTGYYLITNGKPDRSHSIIFRIVSADGFILATDKDMDGNIDTVLENSIAAIDISMIQPEYEKTLQAAQVEDKVHLTSNQVQIPRNSD
ncbi:MAG: hypothetical protein K9N46_11165 [Candidatus Marinimicrobia bacterium]|nr:hypothetical protein [Candidatus Neomarinimicrobiota bacterium]MCF7827658.1 hypothetical protein [Candidatus Neomarinimicrobiota bacterium]MCF7881287.1 hypothetical protein [Candidatus Neomarinimicrobiota bacterium]